MKKCVGLFLVLAFGFSVFGTTIKFWTCPFIDRPDEFLAPLVQKFKAETGIDVEISVVSYGEAVVKYQAAIAAGEAPDIMYLTEGRFMPLVAFGGALEPLDNYLTQELRARFARPELLDIYASQAGGVLYVVPIFFVTYLGAINTDILSEAGVPAELLKRMTDPNETYTWDDLRLVGELVKKAGYWLYAYPGATGWLHPFLMWYWNAGGSPTLFDEEGKPAFDTPATVLALSFLSELKEKGYMPPGCEYLDAPDAIGLFTAGKTAFINNVWPSNMLMIWPSQFPNLHFQPVYPPTGPAGKRTTYFGSGLLAIARQSKFKSEAWKFIEFLLSDEAQSYLAKSYYFPITGVLPEEWRDNKTIKMYYDVLAYAIPEPMHPAMAKIKTVYNMEVQAVLIGKKTPVEAARDMQRQVEEILKYFK